MQEEDKKEPAAAGKPPSFCDRLQSAFHARPAFRPLRRLTASHQDGATKPTDAGGGAAPAEPARNKHGGPPVPAPPRPLAPAPTAPRAPRLAPVHLPAVTTPTSNKKAAVSSVPTGPPVPAPPPDVVTAGAPTADEKAGDKAQQSKGKNSVGFSVRKALSSK